MRILPDVGFFFRGAKKFGVGFVFSKGKKTPLRNKCQCWGKKTKHIFQISRGGTKQQYKRKMLREVCKDWKKNCEPNNKKSVVPFDLGIGAPPKILTNRVASKQNILGHVWEFCSLSRIHGYWICSKKKPGPFFSLESCGPPPKKKSSGRSEFSLTFCWVVFLVGDVFLVGGFNPSEKYYSNWIISPSRGENKKYLSCHHLVFVVCGVCSLSIPQENQNRNSFRPVGVSWAAFSRASLMSAV